MADDPKSRLESAFASNASNRPPPPKEQWEIDANLYDSLGLAGGLYWMDERDLHMFQGWSYDERSREWLGRFDPSFTAVGEELNDPYSGVCYVPYHKVLRAAQIMVDNGIKPSQSYRAIRAFWARLDAGVAMLTDPRETLDCGL